MPLPGAGEIPALKMRAPEMKRCHAHLVIYEVEIFLARWSSPGQSTVAMPGPSRHAPERPSWSALRGAPLKRCSHKSASTIDRVGTIRGCGGDFMTAYQANIE